MIPETAKLGDMKLSRATYDHVEGFGEKEGRS